MKSILTTKSSAVTLKIWSEQKNWWEKLLELGDLFYEIVHSKLTKILRFHYDELIRNIEEHEWKEIFDDWWLYVR